MARSGPELPPERPSSATALRERARRIRQHARTFVDDEAGERLAAFARELEEHADRLEAGSGTEGGC